MNPNLHLLARRTRRRSTAVWAVAVFAALGLLAVLGVRGIQRGRESTLESARMAAAGAAERVAQIAGTRIGELRAQARKRRIYPLVPQPPATFETNERYERALSLPPEQADTEFAALLQAHPDAATSAGIPLGAMIAWTQFSRDPDHAAIDRLGHAVVDDYPSLLSLKLLESAAEELKEKNLPADSIDPWMRRWSEDEQIREILRRAQLDAAAWVTTGDGQRYWIEPEGSDVWRATNKAELQMLALAALQEGAELLAPSVQLSADWGGETFLAAGEGERLARRDAGLLSVSALLKDPEQLFREQRAQAVWLAALLGVALLAVTAAFIAMQRSLTSERQLNQQKSDFVASVSHELRAPVSSMRLMLENLQSGAVSTESSRTEYLRLLEGECRRLSALIENVLDYARIEHGRKSYEMAETDVRAMIEDVIQLLEPRAAQRRQRLVTELEPIEPAPLVDALALQHAVINLIDNAMKFSPPETTITTRTKRRGAMEWEISVSDEGPGIPKAEHARIFDRFYRIGNELRRETQGAGIGLALVKHAVEAHGGRIEIESSPDEKRGATFRLILPSTELPN